MPSFVRLPVGAVVLVIAGRCLAHDVTESLSIGGVLAAAGQCQGVSARLPSENYEVDGSLEKLGNACRSAVPFQLEVSFQPDDFNEFFFKLGFAAGNGLNEVSPWVLAPWSADLEDDVRDINGRNRDHLLAAWYKHTFTLGPDHTLGASFGILASFDYLDGNEFANDEYTQFMNEVFANSNSYGLPSYDAGAVLEWASGPWSVNALVMNIGENEDGDSFNFLGVQTRYQTKTVLGNGNYRLILAGTSSEFLNPAGTKKEGRLAWGLSFDQAFGEVVGGFLRMTWQKDDAAVDHKALYSGGLNFNGSGWYRNADNIGIGYAYLEGGNLDVEHTQVFEAYYRFGINDYFAVTADVQYMKDDRIRIHSQQDNPDGWLFGLRATVEF